MPRKKKSTQSVVPAVGRKGLMKRKSEGSTILTMGGFGGGNLNGGGGGG